MIRLAGAQRGYTMAEVLVVSAVVAFIMAGLFTLVQTGQQTFTAGTNRAEAQQNARLALDRMLYELRTAGYDPLNTGTFTPVTAAGAGTGFVIRNDWDGNGVITTAGTVLIDSVTHGETVTYTYAGTTLTRQESGLDAGPVTVTNGITGLTVQYLDANDTAVASPSGPNAATIRTVVLDVTTRPDTSPSGTANQVAVKSVTRVRIRNR